MWPLCSAPDITKKMAIQALNTGILGIFAGTVVFEGLHIGYPSTIPAKIGIAAVVMISLGIATYDFYTEGGRL